MTEPAIEDGRSDVKTLYAMPRGLLPSFLTSSLSLVNVVIDGDPRVENRGDAYCPDCVVSGVD